MTENRSEIMGAPPTPSVRVRPLSDEALEQARALTSSELAARVLAARAVGAGVSPEWLCQRELRHLDPPNTLPDIDRAAERIATAVRRGETIAIETDHDVDGQTSHAVLYRALTEGFAHPGQKVQSFIGHRLTEGYGLSEGVCQRILEATPRPSLVITADNGSSDGPRIERLQSEGIDVVVTDHHEVPVEGPPPAYACVNPTRSDSSYPDPLIAGVAVSWLLVMHTRSKLPDAAERGAGFSWSGLLDYVALGTVADCVSLSRSRNNRIWIDAGLRLINSPTSRPCWNALRGPLRAEERPLTAQDLAFGIGPRLNARGRLDEAMAGVHFLLAGSGEEATRYATLLEGENQARKAIELELKNKAMELAHPQYEADAAALIINFPSGGHPGVHGIVASRLVERYGRPVACFSVKNRDPAVLTGSLRGVPGTNIVHAMQAVAERAPDLFIAYGGHEGAGGCSLPTMELERFIALYREAIAAQPSESPDGPVVDTDGSLPGDRVTLEAARSLQQIGPYGRDFPEALFEFEMQVEAVRALSDGAHYRLQVRPAHGATPDERSLNAIWFNYPYAEPPTEGSVLRALVALEVNVWRGNESVQLRIKHRLDGA